MWADKAGNPPSFKGSRAFHLEQTGLRLSCHKDFPAFIKDFKWQTVEGRIMSDNKLEVTKEDLNAEALKLARYQFAMYGLNNVPEEHLKGYAANILADDKQGRRIAEKAQENVVLAFVRKTVTIDNKEISSADLRKMNE